MIGAGLMAAFGSWATLEMLGGREAAASTLAGTSRVSVVGDSLTVGTMPYQAEALSAAGLAQSAIDAYGSRGVRTKLRADPHTGLTAVDAIRAGSGDSQLWIVALGTNDACIYSHDRQPDLIRLMMDRIGSGHRVLWVNVYLPKTPERHQAWNAALTTVALERPDEMVVFDWASLAAANEPWLTKDQVHYSSTGYRQRSNAIAEALRDHTSTSPARTALRPHRSWQPWMKRLATDSPTDRQVSTGGPVRAV